ncbi:hypothetical protein ACT453_31730, partial [Bacillus sp. D-CC]
ITTVTNSNFVVTQVNTAQLNIQKSASVQQAANVKKTIPTKTLAISNNPFVCFALSNSIVSALNSK